MYVHASLRLPSRLPSLYAIVDNPAPALQQWLVQHLGWQVSLANVMRDHSDRAVSTIDSCFGSVIEAWSSMSPLAGGRMVVLLLSLGCVVLFRITCLGCGRPSLHVQQRV